MSFSRRRARPRSPYIRPPSPPDFDFSFPRPRRCSLPRYGHRIVRETWRHVTVGPGGTREEEREVRITRDYSPDLFDDARERGRSSWRCGSEQRRDDATSRRVRPRNQDDETFLMSGANGPGDSHRPSSRPRTAEAAEAHEAAAAETPKAKPSQASRAPAKSHAGKPVRREDYDDGEWYCDIMGFRGDGSVASRDDKVYVLGSVLERKRF